MEMLVLASLLIATLSVGCSKPVKAQVNCQEHAQGFSCGVSTEGGGGQNFNVCWDIKVTCGNGQKLGASTCQEVGGNGKASSVVPNARFTGGNCKVGSVTGVAVDNVKIVKK